MHTTKYAHRRAGVSLPTLYLLASLIIGALVGLAVALATEVPWIGIAAGVGAAILALIIFGAIYYYSDFTRYMNIRRM